jgi:hypothetical protein
MLIVMQLKTDSHCSTLDHGRLVRPRQPSNRLACHSLVDSAAAAAQEEEAVAEDGDQEVVEGQEGVVADPADVADEGVVVVSWT